MTGPGPLQKANGKPRKPGRAAVFGMGLLFFVILGALAFALCNLRVQNVSQNIISHNRDLQKTWLDKSLESIRKWRNDLVEQARFISSSEIFRLFVTDTQNLSPREVATLRLPETLHSRNENLRALAEQLLNLQNLLRDFTARRAWKDARILLPNGNLLAAPDASAPLLDSQMELARKAAMAGQYIFGSIRRDKTGFVMDIADPLFDLLGATEPKIVAVLLLTISMDQPLSTFLARQGDGSDLLLPRIVDKDNENLFMLMSRRGHLQIEPVTDPGLKMEAMPFGLRRALDGKAEVYSIGGMPTSLDWLFVIETPKAEIEAALSTQRWHIYSLGVLASLGIALLCAWLWSGYRSRHYMAEASKYENLYATINDQKMVLDSINSSFQAGLALVDAKGRIQMANPSFCEICGANEGIEKGMPLVKILPDKVAIHLLEDINNVREARQTASDEVTIPKIAENGAKENRLYRVSLYPYSEKGASQEKSSGCVLIFKDITEFRQNAIAEKERALREQKRYKALIRAFQRAIESVDPHLLGQSDKMAALAQLLAEELQFGQSETETLELSARLSQIGKIYVPHHLLVKTGELTPAEKKEVQKAPEHAQRILAELDFSLPIRETIAEIYERVDGSGKPNGLTGKELSSCGRALAVINAFIAMTSPRAWRNAEVMGIEDALAELRKNAGFDQNIVEALCELPTEKLYNIINAKPDEMEQQ